MFDLGINRSRFTPTFDNGSAGIGGGAGASAEPAEATESAQATAEVKTGGTAKPVDGNGTLKMPAAFAELFQKQDFTPTDFTSALDAHVNKALQTAKSTWEQNAKKLVDAAISEDRKLARMTQDQRDEHERQKRESELTERETKIAQRELRAQALETLAERKLKPQLADCLVYTNPEECVASIDRVEKAFRDAVSEEVQAALAGKTTPRSGAKGADASLDAGIAMAKKLGKEATGDKQTQSILNHYLGGVGTK